VIDRADYDAVSFDVYGTILDWEPDIAAFLTSWAEANGLDLTARQLLEAYDRLRRPIQELRPALLYPEVVKRTLDALGEAFGQAFSHLEREAFGGIAATHRPFSDSVAALDALRAMGLTLAALSNIDDRSFNIATNNAGIGFDVVVTAERVGAYKPDPVHFRTALSDLEARGIPKQRVLHVAQSRRADIVPANALSLACVWVNRPGHIFGRSGDGAESAKPNFEVESLEHLVRVLGGPGDSKPDQ